MVADILVDVRIQVRNATLLLHPPFVRKMETRKWRVKLMIILHLLNGLKRWRLSQVTQSLVLKKNTPL
ncbi:hypothetical protein BRARA_A01879 [Brassica rapa]|uniref:Uncharacterized protein n=1 Tax=Brassica campestris TaxID=3711 RepID=A0A398AN75_BRACM|nr:hypothetical protein BRARA_A01879 [Brassica rapa]